MIQKYFTGSDQLTLTDTKLEEALRNGSSTNVDSAREDILAKLRVSMMKTMSIFAQKSKGKRSSKSL